MRQRDAGLEPQRVRAFVRAATPRPAALDAKALLCQASVYHSHAIWQWAAQKKRRPPRAEFEALD